MANVGAGFHRPRCTRRLARLLPDDFWMHHRAARRQRILSWGSLLEAAAARLEEPPRGTGETSETQLIPDSFWAHRAAARQENLLAVRSLVESFFSWWEAVLEEPPAAEATTRIEVE
jgi:hypothetical protein